MPHRTRTLQNVLLCLVSIALSTMGLRRVLPSSEGDLLQAKLHSMTSRTGEDAFNVAFIGSSRTYHGFIPEVFDQVMAEKGFAMRSYNLGISGLRIEGTLDALESLQAREPQNLDWVFMDPESTKMIVKPQRRRMKGVVRWHDPRTTWWMLRYLMASDEPAETQLELGSEMALACCYQIANLGGGVPLIDELLERSVDEETTAYRIGPRKDGFRAKDHATGPAVQRAHQKFLETFPAFRREVNRFKKLSLESEPLTPEALPLFRGLEQVVRDMGAEPIFVIVPSQNLQGELIDAHAKGEVTTLFRYNDAKRYPEFYTKESRWEVAHLSLHGAQLFTRRLAEDFAAFLEARESDQ